MRKVACTVCPNCGLYNDISVRKCECGRDLQHVPQVLTDEKIPLEKFGEISSHRAFYIQKCPACGTVNLTADYEKRVTECFNCHKKRISAIEPTLYVEEEVKEEPSEVPTSVPAPPQMPEAQSVFTQEDPDEAAEVAAWSNRIQSLRATVSLTPLGKAEEEPCCGIVECEEDILDAGGWAIPGLSMKKSVTAVQKESELIFNAVRFGRFSFSIKSSEALRPVMLGRSAFQAEFLSNDGRVSNEHCTITFRSGEWFVQDNHSSNGTLLNKKDLGLDGESRLQDGDELMLGHHPDSMEFRINIR